jgi:hypothetical protein
MFVHLIHCFRDGLEDGWIDEFRWMVNVAYNIDECIL